MKLVLATILMFSSALSFAQVDLNCEIPNDSSYEGKLAKSRGETIFSCFSNNKSRNKYSVLLQKSLTTHTIETDLTFEKNLIPQIKLFCPNLALPKLGYLQNNHLDQFESDEIKSMNIHKVEHTPIGGKLKMYKLLGSECSIRGISKFKGKLSILRGDKNNFVHLLDSCVECQLLKEGLWVIGDQL